MKETWVVDASIAFKEQPDLLCFVPVENLGTPDVKYIVGMNFLTTPEGMRERKDCKVVGIIHQDGQEAVEKWITDNPDIYKRLRG